MTTQTQSPPVAADPVASRQTDILIRFNLAILENPAILEEIPNGCTLILLPDEDPEVAQREMASGLASVRRGRNVYFRHVRVADLPERPAHDADAPPPPGLRRAFFNDDGSVQRAEVVGPDGTWHEVDPATVPPATVVDE